MNRSERFRQRAVAWLCAAILMVMITIAASCATWAILAPMGAAWVAAIALWTVGSAIIGLCVGQAIRFFDASEKSRHHEAQN